MSDYGAHEAIAKSSFACTWCGEQIDKGTRYFWFPNYVEDLGFCGRNFHHPECQKALQEAYADQWTQKAYVRGTSTRREGQWIHS
jgi:hypothetical protein